MDPKKKLPEMKIELKYYLSKADFLFSFSIFQLVSHFNSLWIATTISHQFSKFVISLPKIWKCEPDLLSLLVQERENLIVLEVVVERMVRVRNRDCVILVKDLHLNLDLRNFFLIHLELLNCNFISLELSFSFLNSLKLIGNK